MIHKKSPGVEGIKRRYGFDSQPTALLQAPLEYGNISNASGIVTFQLSTFLSNGEYNRVTLSRVSMLFCEYQTVISF